MRTKRGYKWMTEEINRDERIHFMVWVYSDGHEAEYRELSTSWYGNNHLMLSTNIQKEKR